MQNITIQALQKKKWGQTRSGDILTKKGSHVLSALRQLYQQKRHSAWQVISALSQNSKVHYCVHNSPTWILSSAQWIQPGK